MDNGKFQKATKPLCANKIKVKNKKTLSKDSRSIKDDQKLLTFLTLSFANTTSNLNISYNKSLS